MTTPTLKSFPVKLARPSQTIVLEHRAGIADRIRNRLFRKISVGEEAGIDLFSVAQRTTMGWAQAAQSARMLRSFPLALVNWAINAEINTARNNAERVPANTMGTFNTSVISILEGGVAVIRMGGVDATGLSGEVDLHLVREVRLTLNDDDSVTCTLVLYNNEGEREEADEPADSDLVDA